MRICYVSPEFFGWGVHGGFGYLTRRLSSSLSAKGFDVSVVTLRRKGQGRLENVEGVKIYGYEPYYSHPKLFQSITSRVASLDAYRAVNSDIYHSEAVSYNTLMAQHASPGKIHVITFQDPYDEEEWKKIAKVDKRYRYTAPHMLRIDFERRALSRACKNANSLYSQAHFLVSKAKKLFNIRRQIGFLPNPVPIPKHQYKKSATPNVCFLARWDPQKRVERFLELARLFPSVRFIAMGQGHDVKKDHELRKKYRKISNLVMTGFVSEKEKSRILAESWALVNTSIREALPVSFLEALAHETPIISGENPDNLTSSYGYLVTRDDYSSAIQRLLSDDDRSLKGKLGRRLVKQVYESRKVVDLHVKVYERLMEEAS